jgi:hypothetical protein
MNLIEIGLASQAQSLALANATYTRIVQGNELLADVHEEAQQHGCKVWANSELRKTVICKNRPGDNDSYIQVHVKAGRVHQVFGPKEAA